MFTTAQRTEFLAAVDQAAKNLDLDLESRVALLTEAAVQELIRESGPVGAARRMYVLTMNLAAAAGIDMPSLAKH